MKMLFLTALLTLALSPALAFGGTIKIPKDEPAATLNIPDSWEPEDADDGVLAESPDNVATIFFKAVATEKEMGSLIDDSIDWLTKEHDVKIDEASKSEKDFEDSGRKWSRISWDGVSKEWGPAVVGFLFTDLGNGKVLTVTYWISKKDSEKNLDILAKIFSSVKAVD
ncbi:MAG: hypothetical protein D4R65_03300 [Verrucomicrobiaceae bacterium]|nr:MAG: hypothetical protein D4R65_03300 [Verrucomicrobiaceae bacterium]